MYTPPHFSLSLAHFLSLSPVSGNTTTADLNSPVFQPSQTCQVTKSSVWVTGLQTKPSTTTRQQLVISFLHFDPTDDFLPLCWGKTWRSPGLGSDSGSEHRDVETLHKTKDGNVAADSDSVFQQSQFSGL